jgi:alpha-galactosidase
LNGSDFAGRAGVPLVQIFTAHEQRARTSQAYIRSAVGDRLRVAEYTQRDRGDHMEGVVLQVDEQSGIVARTTFRQPRNSRTWQVQTAVTNTADTPITLTVLSFLTLGFGHSEEDLDDVRLYNARSAWLAENRWTGRPIREVLPRLNLAFRGQDGRGHYGVTSHGAWSPGEHLPAGFLTCADGATIAWQIETSGPWHWELSQTRDGGVLTALGPTDLEHHFAVTSRRGRPSKALQPPSQ